MRLGSKAAEGFVAAMAGLPPFASLRAAEELRALAPSDFVLLVAEAFRRQGYEVRERGTHALHGGIDFELHRDGEVFLVRCVHGRLSRAAPVRDFFSVLSRSGDSGGFLVTSGRFSEDAVAFAQDTHLQLVDGSELFALIRHAGRRTDR
jgi:restriction system protein